MSSAADIAAAMADALNLLGEASTAQGIARLRRLKGDADLKQAVLEALDECLGVLARALPVSSLDAPRVLDCFMAAKAMLPAVDFDRTDEAGGLAAAIRAGLEAFGLIPRAAT